MTDEFTTILSLLPRITMEERHQLRTRLAYARTLFSPGTDNGDEALAIRAICQVLASKGIEYPSLPLLSRWPGYSAFCAKVPGVIKFLSGPGKITRSETSALLTFAVELLMEDLQSMNLAIGARNLMNHIHRIPAVVNRCFPGYARSGLLHQMILRRKNRPSPHAAAHTPQCGWTLNPNQSSTPFKTRYRSTKEL